jgi:hypothetical protein
MDTHHSSYQTGLGRRARLVLVVMVSVAVFFSNSSTPPYAASTQTDIHGPAGSGMFGQQVTVLPNGNIVVTDPGYDNSGGIPDVGAVYLYNGATGTLISSLVGSRIGDMVGSDGVTVLSSGNYLVVSHGWANGTNAYAGAVTWGNSATGVSGVISSSNSLVGSIAGDSVGSGGVTMLTNGNYLVVSPNWQNGSAFNAGAVTWGNGATGVRGLVSPANSLVGSQINDAVGGDGAIALSNGNYLVLSRDWRNSSAAYAGAVTWGNGVAGVNGPVSPDNSLVGSSTEDHIGSSGITLLNSGNYVVNSPHWKSGLVANAGAVTWGSSATGVNGAVSVDNSLVGSTAYNNIGSEGVTLLKNGNYLVVSFGSNFREAVTWGNGTTGVRGAVSAANSLVGSTDGVQVGGSGITLLSNGNYVVDMPWNSGAVTWADGATGVSGEVPVANSLVGLTPYDYIGSGGVTALSNGNYVVASPDWNNGDLVSSVHYGAVTLRNGATGAGGTVSASNSLVGSAAYDFVGNGGVTALNNGNYVVASYWWHNSAGDRVGAVTWGNGVTGVIGPGSEANSLVGSTNDDGVGGGGVTALNNGNYVISSPYWDGGAALADAGAVTWGNGTTGVSGTISAGNSLVGSAAGDFVACCDYSGSKFVIPLNNGNYVISSPYWHGAIGAVTWGNGMTGVRGIVSAANSLVGSTSGAVKGDWIGCFVVNVGCWGSGVMALSSGNYIVMSPNWNNGPAAAGAGAVTWGNGAAGTSGPVSASNSLVGSNPNDQIGKGTIFMLSNGNYVVMSPNWNNGTAAVGAVTWGNGISGVKGAVTATNSLVGSTAGDGVGSVSELINGSYLVGSPSWDNGPTADAGAITPGSACADGPTSGVITITNSVRGATEGGGNAMNSAYDSIHHQLVVGRPADNVVTLFPFMCVSYSQWIFLPVVIR